MMLRLHKYQDLNIREALLECIVLLNAYSRRGNQFTLGFTSKCTEDNCIHILLIIYRYNYKNERR